MEEKIKQTLKTLKEKLKMFGTKEDTQKTEHKPNSKENVNKRQNVNLESKSELRQMKEKPEETIKKEKNEKQKTPSISESPYKKMKLYIPGIDELFTEGVPEGSSIIIEGGPGSGKTAFCLNLLHEQCIRGRKVLYMSFEEPEDRLKQHMRDFGWNPDALEKKGLLLIKRFQALDISRSVEALLSEAKRELLIDIQPVLIPTDFEPELICVDSLSAIASAFSGEESRFRIYMEQLFRYLEKHKITSFLIRETPTPTHIGGFHSSSDEAISFLSDGIIVLYNVIYSDGRRGRAIEILKMRGDEIDRRIVEAEMINKKGIVVYPKRQLKGSYKLT